MIHTDVNMLERIADERASTHVIKRVVADLQSSNAAHNALQLPVFPPPC